MFKKLTVAGIVLSLSGLVFAGTTPAAPAVVAEAAKAIKPCFIEFNTSSEAIFFNVNHVQRFSVVNTNLYITFGNGSREVISYPSKEAALEAARRLVAKSQECK